MLHRRLSRTELHPRLSKGASEISLYAYARPHTGEMLADDGSRWGVLILPGGGYQLAAFGEGEPVALSFLAAGVQAFVLDYSVSPDVWPQPFLEAAAALAWIRAPTGWPCAAFLPGGIWPAVCPICGARRSSARSLDWRRSRSGPTGPFCAIR